MRTIRAVVILGMALFLAGLIVSVIDTAPAHPDELSAYLERAVFRQASILAKAYCERAGCSTSPIIAVEAEMPRGVRARTTMTADGQRCILHFTRTSLIENDALAHEACHCAADHRQIDEIGWKLEIPLGERTTRDAIAKDCAARVMIGGR